MLGSCRLGRLLRQPSDSERTALSQTDGAPAYRSVWVRLRPVLLLLSPEKTIIVGWGVPHPQRWRYEKTQGQIHSLPRVSQKWFELGSGPVLLLVNRAPLDSLSFSSLILAV